MMVVIWTFLATAILQSPTSDSLRLLALRLPESALIVEARARAAATREAVTDALARAVKGPARERDEALRSARQLANAYAVAWSDSFLVREVSRFAGWPSERRAAKVWSDSVRRAGIAAYSRDGPRSAIAIWRRALARSAAIGDTAGMAAALGNIGAGLSREMRLDSAELHLERARQLGAAVGDKLVEANALGALAGVSADRGDLAKARERHAQALALRERIGDTRGVAADHNNLGLIAQTVGDLDEARRRFETALELNRRDRRDDVAATNLVNLAGLASLSGDFAEAEMRYRDALAVWRDREMWAEVADALRGLGQLELRRGDYPAARAALSEALAIYNRTGPLGDALAVRSELAGALGAAGDLQRALDELRRAQHVADSARAPPGVRAGIALQRADLAVRFNHFAMADDLYARAQLLYRRAADGAGEAEAQQGRGVLFLERDDHARAQTWLERALRTQLSAGNLRGAALTRLSLGQLALERGDTARARRQAASAVAELERLGDPVATAAALGERAAVEARLGLPVTAESLYRSALRRVAGKVAPDVTWRLRVGLALTRRAEGFADEATRELRSALDEIERSSRSLVAVERRSGFLADKWDAYAQLARIERDRGHPAAAFEVSERLRAREMLELLSRGRIAVPPHAAAELVAREQDLRRRVAELTRDVESGTSADERLRGADASPANDASREALVRAQNAYAELLTELRERAPRHEGLVSRGTATWRDVARRLAPTEVLVEYLVSDSGSVAFVVGRDSVVGVELGPTRRELARLVEFARGTLEPRQSFRGDSLWRGPLRRLYQHLILPVQESGLLATATRLVLVPHAELHYLPFAALIAADGRVLVDRYELTVTPSASVWLALGDRPTREVGTGVIAFAPRPDVLPASRREVASVGRLAGASVRVLIAREATEEAFRRDAPTRRVVHLATYGVLNRHNPLFSFVELAPGGGDDGRLEVHEVFGLRLKADLVVLSACQTGLGSGALADVPSGDDWVGLTRAFLHAGAKRVVATLWPVNDWATAALMERFYEEVASGADPARALASAQRTIRSAPATAHPFYWAGFVVVGGAEIRTEER